MLTIWENTAKIFITGWLQELTGYKPRNVCAAIGWLHLCIALYKYF